MFFLISFEWYRMMVVGTTGLFLLLINASPVKSFVGPRIAWSSRRAIKTRVFSTAKEQDVLLATIDQQQAQQPNHHQDQQQQTQRELGAQELLMLPRQYMKKNGGPSFPPMNHVSVALLETSSTTTESLALMTNDDLFRRAVHLAAQSHGLLRSIVIGDGEPNRRIDLFQMVRSGDPNPPTFSIRIIDNDNDDVNHNNDPTSTSYSHRIPITILDYDTDEAWQESWQSNFQRDLDNGQHWCDPYRTLLWKVELHRVRKSHRAAILLSFNHAISDQTSANRLLDQIITYLVELENSANGGGTTVQTVVPPQPIPPSMEDALIGGSRYKDIQTASILNPQTLSYIFGKAAEGLKDPVILPDDDDPTTTTTTTIQSDGDTNKNALLGALTLISGNVAGGRDDKTPHRKSTIQFRSWSKESTERLLQVCRQQGVTMSHALTAAMAYTATDFVGTAERRQRNYKILQSLDMRRFIMTKNYTENRRDDDEDDEPNIYDSTISCMAGSHDLLFESLRDQTGASLRQNPTPQRLEDFWKLARKAKEQTEAFVLDSKGPREAVRVFDFAMTISDLNNLVYLSSQSKDTKGRAYSAGVTNAGVLERQSSFFGGPQGRRRPIALQYGEKYKITDVFYATPHVTSGCLYPVSCMTVDGSLKFTFNPVEPIVSPETNQKFADAFIELLETVSNPPLLETRSSNNSPSWEDVLSEGFLTKTSLALGMLAVSTHASAYGSFLQSVLEMKANTMDNPEEFWAALNFWIFFAVGHPILQPILWISDVLHGSPGPLIAGLVPLTFLLGNALVLWAIAVSSEIRNAANIAAVAAFFTYVGAGLDGTAGLGDYNLALDDSYEGQIVKGCPAYDQVKLESMNNFDLEKYQGLWYEQKFHDWTQFKEVYDTTLKIKLIPDGWVDDFAVKGPAPDSAPLSWDKSPVANGAHYFLFGRVDPADPPGILREKGFGVEFPNYIVDVKKDPKTGEYTEAIQFQCLERGGVRVFEGINFLSRNPTMTDSEMAQMHERAQAAGMYPYGASPEQMHTVARRPADAPALDNSWQTMWKALGVDRLLELLTKSIEDGGR